MDAEVDVIVSHIGQNAPLLLLLDHYRPIRDTKKSALANEGIEKKRKKTLVENCFPGLETVP